MAKLYGLGDLVKADEKTSNTAGDADGESKARGESELPERFDVAYDRGDGRCSFHVTRVTAKRPTLQLSGNARCSCLLQDSLRDGMSGL